MLKDRPEVPVQPAMNSTASPGELLELLKFQGEKGEELLKKNFLSMEDVRYWKLFTKDVLTQIFGPNPEYINSIIHAGEQKPYPAFEPESILEKERRKDLEGMIERLKEIGEELISDSSRNEKSGDAEKAEESMDRWECPQEAVENVADEAGQEAEEEKVDLALRIESTTIEVNRGTEEMERTGSRKILVIQGEDEEKGMAVLNFLKKLELEPVIPPEQSGQRMRWIEKFDQHSGIGFAITLLTAEDTAYPLGKPEESKLRPKQNLVFELGFLVGRLEQDRVCALHEEGLDLPSEFSRRLFIPYDADGLWRLLIARAMKIANVQVDLNKAV